MSELAAFESVLEEVKDVHESQMKSLNMPVDVYIIETLRLYEWVQEDKATLESIGFNWEIVEKLPVYAAALRQAQSVWNNERFKSDKAQKLWNERSPEAYELKGKLLHTFRFAFRKNPELITVIHQIGKGTGHADMLQDLNDLAVAARNNTTPLNDMRFDMSLIDRCETLVTELGMVYAEARNERTSYHDAKKNRDAIATRLKELVDDVREHGQFLFWQDESRRKGYGSEYHRQVNRNTPSSPETPETPEQTPTEQEAEA